MKDSTPIFWGIGLEAGKDELSDLKNESALQYPPPTIVPRYCHDHQYVASCFGVESEKCRNSPHTTISALCTNVREHNSSIRLSTNNNNMECHMRYSTDVRRSNSEFSIIMTYTS